MITGLSRILRKVSDFLLAFANKKFLIFLYFLALSSVFWLAMALNETVEKELSVPIRLVNIPRNAIITTPMPDSVRVTLRDKGFSLLSYMYGDKLRPLTVNFNTYANKATGIGVVPMNDIQKMILQSLYLSTKITGIKPDKFEYYYNYGLSKKVSVRITGSIKTAHGYYISQIRCYPERVTVYANVQVLNGISHIYTQPLNLTQVLDTMQTVVALQKIKGVKVVPEKVHLTIYPDILTEESVEVPVTTINVPEDKALRTFPSRAKIIFSVGAAKYRNVDATDFKVDANYNDIANRQNDKCPLRLTRVPDYVSNARLEIDKVDYLVEQQ